MPRHNSGSNGSNPFGVPSDVDFAVLRGVKQQLAREYLGKASSGFRTRALSPRPESNVVGVGVGEKIVSGKSTGTPAVKVYVRRKFAPHELTRSERIPARVDGVVLDVVESGTFSVFEALAVPALDPRARHRPAAPGCSIGFSAGPVMAGTLGAVVRSGSTTCILSNNHVLANENRMEVGSVIHQPAPLDRAPTRRSGIARLARFEPLGEGVNHIDAAIAAVEDDDIVTPEVLLLGSILGQELPRLDMLVHKVGRTTGYTVGRITDLDFEGDVDYDTGVYRFDGQMVIESVRPGVFSSAGDSGSLIIERNSRCAVGLLFAGSAAFTLANPIEPVLSSLEVTLL